MCEHGKTKKVYVKIPADLSNTGKEKWKYAKIDRCIAPIVGALQREGIDMRGSCCGHDSSVGDIHLQDGRIILILGKEYESLYYGRELNYLISKLLKKAKDKKASDKK